MILNAQPKQFTLKDDGQILFQVDASNPLPGQPVAQIRKGDSILRPALDLLPVDLVQGQDADAVKAFVTTWLHTHISTTLEFLEGLLKGDDFTGPVRDIAARVHDAMGIVPRQNVEDLIAQLDPETRKVLRQRHVRLGPVLIFVPELNKPAAVKLRALLWWMWSDRPLPAPVPKDGAVSIVVDEAQIDALYYRSIGYPVYGGRAIRVDMLDRLISAIYDTAKNGVFKAEHKMAEWMGCSVADLYKILEAMGHKKIDEPAATPVAVVTEAAEPVVAAEPAPENVEPVNVEPVSVEPAKVEPAKPELASFRLKRGKAGVEHAPRPARFERSKTAAAKPVEGEGHKKPSFNKDAPRKPKFNKSRDAKDHKPEKKPMVFEAKAKTVGDSPFAALQALKDK